MKTTIKPVDINLKFSDELERYLKKLIADFIYKPLVKALDAPIDVKLENAKESALTRALKRGDISYTHGAFEGKFSAQVTKELSDIGAKWSSSSKSFLLPKTKLPDDMHATIVATESRAKESQRKIMATLDNIDVKEMADQINVKPIYDRAIRSLVGDLDKTIPVVTPSFTQAQKNRISENYNDNMKLYIQDFSKQEIKLLRAKVSTRHLKGLRYEGMLSDIEKSFGTSASKAKFLARQETNLLGSQIKKETYQGAGLEYYMWKTFKAGNHEVRPDHQDLDGTIHSWDNPPAVNKKTGKRAHPREDFNCFCRAVPITRSQLNEYQKRK